MSIKQYFRAYIRQYKRSFENNVEAAKFFTKRIMTSFGRINEKHKNAHIVVITMDSIYIEIANALALQCANSSGQFMKDAFVIDYNTRLCTISLFKNKEDLCSFLLVIEPTTYSSINIHYSGDSTSVTEWMTL